MVAQGLGKEMDKHRQLHYTVAIVTRSSYKRAKPTRLPKSCLNSNESEWTL